MLLPGKSHGRRSLASRSPWGRQQSDTTEHLHFHFSLSCTGEGNGNPLQCSCLENPRDGGAWWAAVYGVAQSRTRLKWLGSSSSREEFGNVINLRMPTASSLWRVSLRATHTHVQGDLPAATVLPLACTRSWAGLSQLFPALHSGMSVSSLRSVMSRGEIIHTSGISKHYKQGLSFFNRKLMVKHLLVHHCKCALCSFNFNRKTLANLHVY